MHVLLEVCAKHIKRLQHAHERRRALRRDLALERLEEMGQQEREGRLEFALERTSDRLHQRHNCELDR